MNYARFGQDGSDVYVYDSLLGGVVCFACALNLRTGPWRDDDPPYPNPTRLATHTEMIAHLKHHRSVGHHVPAHTIANLEIARTTARAIAELEGNA